MVKQVDLIFQNRGEFKRVLLWNIALLTVFLFSEIFRIPVNGGRRNSRIFTFSFC